MKTSVTRVFVITALGVMVARHSIAAQSLIEKVAAERIPGGLIITGTIEKVPPGTKIEIEIIREVGRVRRLTDRPSAEAFVGPGGVFRANLSNGDGAPFPAGTYVVQITAMFNRPWQSVKVLRKAGVEMDSQGRSDLHTNPKALPETPDFKPFDPEFPKAGRYIEVRRDVTVGMLPGDAVAIEAVKGARLLVRGAGRSSLPVGKSVEWFESAPGFRQKGCSAARGAGGVWIVTLDCVDGGKTNRAQWQYDPRTKDVKYLDPLAKTLSYVPPK